MSDLHEIAETKGLLFICMNARSVYNKRTDAFKLICSADVTGIVETWLTPSVNDFDMFVPGYQYCRLDRFPNRDKKSGGLMLYLRDSYIAIIDQASSFITEEYEILCVDVEVGNIKYKIYVCYRPPDAHLDKNAIYAKLTDLKKTVSKNRKIIMMGDFNVNLFDKKDVRDSRVDDFCTENEMFQLMSSPTRPVSGTLLDHIYTNVHNVFESGLINFHISDHTPIFHDIKMY